MNQGCIDVILVCDIFFSRGWCLEVRSGLDLGQCDPRDSCGCIDVIPVCVIFSHTVGVLPKHRPVSQVTRFVIRG